MNVLEARQVEKRFGDRAILRGVTLSIARGEVLALLGISGSGKSTFARLVVGMLPVDGGSIVVSGTAVRGIDGKRPLSYAPQEDGLWDTLTVRRQLGLALRSPRARFEVGNGVSALAEAGHLSHRLDARPSELSGGELRRLAVLRAIAVDCDLLVLDEPFAAIDAATEAHLQQLLRQYVRDVNCGVLLITHDVAHAIVLAQRAAVLHAGTIVQSDRPIVLIRSPAHASVLRVLGAVNLWPVIACSDDKTSVRTPVGALPIPPRGASEGRRIMYYVPPECMRQGEKDAWIRGRVAAVAPGNRATRVLLRVGENAIVEVEVPSHLDVLESIKLDSELGLVWVAADALLVSDE